MGLLKRILRLRDKTPAEVQAELFFDEIGEHCPFLLAKHLGIVISYRVLGAVTGSYSPDHRCIYINSKASIEAQEDAAYELIMQYLEHPDTARSFTREELKIAVNSRRRGTIWWI